MYHFYVEGDLLPLAPSKLRVRVGSTNEVISLVSMGDYNTLKTIGLKDFNFDIILPYHPLPGMATADNFRPPIYYLTKFEEHKANKKPVRLIITRATQTGADIFTTNIFVGFEDYNIDEEAGFEGEVVVQLRFREAREPQKALSEVVKTYTEVTDGQEKIIAEVTQEPERPEKPKPRKHTVVRGDTLWGIAKRELNDGRRYMEIARLNNIPNPNLIFVGQVLRLP